MTDPRWCYHPNAVLAYRRVPARWRRRRTGRVWQLARTREYWVYEKRCPDCPAFSVELDLGMRVRITLPPWLLGVAEREAS